LQKEIIKLFWNYSKPYAARRWFAIINNSLTVLVAFFLTQYFLSQLFERIQTGNITLDASWPLILSFVLAQIYGEIIGFRLTMLATWTFETAAQRDMYRTIFQKLSSESIDFHSNRFGGSLVSQANKLTGAFERFWDTVVFQVVPVTTSIFAATIILSFYYWQYALFLFLLSVSFAVVVFLGSRFMRKLNLKEARASNKLTGKLADMITNVTTVKSYGREAEELENATTQANAWRQKSLASMRGFLKISTGYSALNVGITTGALIFAIVASEQKTISIAAVYLALTYTFTVARQLWDINGIMRNLNRILADSQDMTEILNAPSRITDQSDTALLVKKGALDLKDVSFAHDDGKGEHVFDQFNLSIPSGQRVGLVGHSGSGKSTLTRLLLRFSDIDAGKILIDGQDIAMVTQRSLREAIAYVPQEPLLFHRSLRENIAYGNPHATEQQILKAATQANALNFIKQLPDGMETMVGERGVKLSGGQRQRIAIARAILKDAPILILDEATSALDSESEKLIQDALGKLMKGRTSIVIAHRLSTIAKLDRIIVLDNGKIVEDGTHKELVGQAGVYSSLWSHQSGGFIEE
jgi:ATP-binding cassette subfamily B protein